MCLFVAIFLLRVGFYIIHSEILERLAGEAQIGGFGHGSSCVPFVNQSSLDEPHRGRPISAGTMDERGLDPWCRDCFQELIDGGGLRFAAVRSEERRVGKGCRW